MNILFLGPKNDKTIKYIESFGNHVFNYEEKEIRRLFGKYDFIVSYRYKHIIPPDILCNFEGRAINLHASYLPWNRGYHPNFWAFMDNTPKGVTIHLMDRKIDTGAIIAQMEVPWFGTDTLKTTYDRCAVYIEKLFELVWLDVENDHISPMPQKGKGSFHLEKDIEKHRELLKKGWNTRVVDLLDPKHDELNERLCHSI